MKAAFLSIFAALATFAAAQVSISDLPACARTCVTSFTTGSNIGGCSSNDIKCICSSSGFLSGIACCLAGSCSVDDQKKATDFATSLCGISGVTNLPTAVTCSSTSAAPSSSTAPPTTATTSSAASTSPSATPNAGSLQNVAGVGAGMIGAAIVALL